MDSRRIPDSQASVADFHRGSPYEHDATAVAGQASTVVSSTLVVSKLVAVASPTIVRSSAIVVPSGLVEAQ
jgi:hypothetical protein